MRASPTDVATLTDACRAAACVVLAVQGLYDVIVAAHSYAPAGFEQVIIIIIHARIPTTIFALPPKGLGMNISQPELMQLFEKIGMHGGCAGRGFPRIRPD